MRQLRHKLKEEKARQIEQKIKNLEQLTSNPKKMYGAIQDIYKNKKPLLTLCSKKGLTTNEEKTTDTLTHYLAKRFTRITQQQMPEPIPIPMSEPFTWKEIYETSLKLNNNKSPDNNGLQAEHIKYAPKCVHQDIANLLNEVAETGTYPIELKHGLIIPIQKPGKQKGKVENIRPVILLSILRKLLATCFIKRISDKIYSMILLSQAAYRKDRSTTEHVFAMKILCEKAMTSCDYSTHTLLLDMTKAFDAINREHLYKLLSDILDPDELNIMNILLKDVTLQVKNNMTKGQTITTLGIPQGDCLSAIRFTLCLSNTISAKIPTHLYDHNYYDAHNMFLAPFEHLHDHNYCIKQDKDIVTDYIIDQQYADNIGFISNNKDIIHKARKNIAPILEERNLTINEKKQYNIQLTEHKKGLEEV